MCSLDVAQPFATVRNRPQPSATIRNRSNVVLRGRRGTFCHILTCLQKCRTSFFVTGAILSRRFHKMSCILRGRCSTLDVCCCVLFANRIVRAASIGDKGTGVGHRCSVAGQYLVQIRCVWNAQYF